MKSQNTNEWLNEFNEFVSCESVEVPSSLSEKVFTKVESLLNPSPLLVFTKIFGIHLIIGFLSLSVCHQFGVNPFGTSFSLVDVFMKWGGHGACMIFCGVLFLSLSLSAAGFFLSVEEVHALRKTEFLQALSLGVISLGIFSMVGAQLALTVAGLWLLGALVGGFATTEAIWYFRRHV